MRRNSTLFALVGSLLALALFGAGCGEDGTEDSESSAIRAPHEKVTICHATGSETNPYVEITINVNAIPAHERHQNLEDIIPAPAEGCPRPEPPPCDCGCECECEKCEHSCDW